MNDKDVFVRLAALESAVDLRHKDAIPALNKALYDETPEVSFAAAKSTLWTERSGRARGAGGCVAGGEAKPSTGSVAAKERDMLRLVSNAAQPHAVRLSRKRRAYSCSRRGCGSLLCNIDPDRSRNLRPSRGNSSVGP